MPRLLIFRSVTLCQCDAENDNGQMCYNLCQLLFATGIHAPRLRVYELSQLSMKFERHVDTEIVDFRVCDCLYTVYAETVNLDLLVSQPLCLCCWHSCTMAQYV